MEKNYNKNGRNNFKPRKQNWKFFQNLNHRKQTENPYETIMKPQLIIS